jgi:hypothetical protein
MGEDERVTLLKELEVNKKTVQDLLNKMPISMRTQSIQRQKKELEEKLLSIEKGIKIMSRKNVFIQV